MKCSKLTVVCIVCEFVCFSSKNVIEWNIFIKGFVSRCYDFYKNNYKCDEKRVKKHFKVNLASKRSFLVIALTKFVFFWSKYPPQAVYFHYSLHILPGCPTFSSYVIQCLHTHIHLKLDFCLKTKVSESRSGWRWIFFFDYFLGNSFDFFFSIEKKKEVRGFLPENSSQIHPWLNQKLKQTFTVTKTNQFSLQRATTTNHLHYFLILMRLCLYKHL